MKTKIHLLLIVCFLFAQSSIAQITKLQAKTSIDSLLPTNTSKSITAARIREAFLRALNFADISNLQNGAISLSKIGQSGATANQVPTWNGMSWVPSTIPAGGSVTGMATVVNVAALRTRVGTSGEMIQTSGYYTANDGGGAFYIWNNTNTETDNSGSVIQVAGQLTGRWMLLHYGYVDARQFGVKNDMITDNYVQLQRAIDFVKSQGKVLQLPNKVISFSQKLQIGTISPSSLPYGESSFTIRGVGPALNPGATAPEYTNGTSLNYTGGASSTDAIIQVNEGASRFVKFEDFTITSTTVGAATYSMLYPHSAVSQHTFKRVHFVHSTRAIGLLEGAGSNGEFFTFEKCVFEGLSAAIYVRQGQGFDWDFYDCQMKVEDGGALIDVGSSALGYSMNFYGLKTSNTWTAGTGNGITLVKNSGTSGNFNFYGGRLEAISTVMTYTLGSFNMNSIVNFSGVHFDGMGSDATRKFIYSNTGTNSAYYKVLFTNCKFSNTYINSSLNIELGNNDASSFIFESCDFEGWKAKKIVTNSSEYASVTLKNCREKDPITGIWLDFNKELKYRLDGLSSRKIDGEHIEQASGIAENLLLQSNFGVNSGSALAPWEHIGQPTFYEVRKIGYGGVNFVSPHSIQAIFRAASGVAQNVTAAPFTSSAQTYYYQAVVSTEFQTGRQITFSLENSSTGKVYDAITITGNSNYAYPLKTAITLKATDSNVGGNLRVKIYNSASDLGVVNIYSQLVSKYADAVFVQTSTGPVTGYTVWSQSSDMLRVSGRFKIPAKTDETGMGASTITDLDSDGSADIYVSTTGGYLTYRAAGKWNQALNTDVGTAAPTTGSWPRGWIRYNSTPVEAGTAGAKYVIEGWQCITAGSPGTWVQKRYLTGN
ncbi:hypothetical protein FHS57_005158 [Runella defluvii]|uniref:Uncharacterized protein n=1 Tax=Runella defluvii TaxID=370973 RepID=A0A7W5ZT89_9BACT|nr:hypothetical protein [Runella defluvii]MBB3841137.1 hypothetical protein [Runella defluvii]